MTNEHAFSALASAILAVALGVRPVAAQVLFQRCDKLLAGVDAMAAQTAGCRAAMTAAQAATAEPEIIESLTVYHAYKAFASGDSQRCAPLSFLGKDAACREIMSEFTFVRSRMSPEADFIKTCLQHRGGVGGDVKPEQARSWCDLIAENGNKPGALCSKAVPGYIPEALDRAPGLPGASAFCRAYFFSLIGDASACRDFPEDMPACLGNAAYSKAFKAKDASLCAGSQRCRVLMGAGHQVAQEIASKLRSPAAAQWFLEGGKPAFVCKASLNKPVVKAALDAAADCLSDMRSGKTPAEASISQGIASRENRLAQSRLRLHKYFLDFGKSKAPEYKRTMR